MKQLLLASALAFAFVMPVTAKEETKNVTVSGKTYEARVPKSAKIDCTKQENKEKIECKKESKTIPKVEKPKETAPADAKKK
jgi:hypothetical protein